MMRLPHALRYSLQGEGWLQRLLLLAVLQLLPVIGQVILIGYGMQVARSVSAGQHDLPPLQPLGAAGDGLRLLIAGLLFVAPILALVPMILTVGTTQPMTNGGVNIDVRGILVTLVMLFGVAPLIRRIPAEKRWLKRLLRIGVMVIALFMIVSTISNLMSSPISLDMSNASLNGVGGVLLGLLVMLVLVVIVGLHIGALRYAIQGKGLFDPTGTIQMVRSNRTATSILVLHLLVLFVVGGAVTALGLPFVLPAALALVVTTVAVWHTLAQYGRRVGLLTAATSR
jgi:succinate dehydrogenase/fumarate reductase cytochrome b subunit